jgi:hypothetical protein
MSLWSNFRWEWVRNSQTCTVYVYTFNNLTLCVVVCCLTNLTARLTYAPLNISVISWRPVIGGRNRSAWWKPLNCRKSLTSFIKYKVMLYGIYLPWTGFELTTLVVIGTYCTGSGKSNYHTITATTAPTIITLKTRLTYALSPSPHLNIGI